MRGLCWLKLNRARAGACMRVISKAARRGQRRPVALGCRLRGTVSIQPFEDDCATRRGIVRIRWHQEARCSGSGPRRGPIHGQQGRLLWERVKAMEAWNRGTWKLRIAEADVQRPNDVGMRYARERDFLLLPEWNLVRRCCLVLAGPTLIDAMRPMLCYPAELVSPRRHL